MRFKFGPALHQLYQAASVGGYALPALNVTNSSQIVAALEAAQRVNSPVVIQFAHAGAQALAGKKIDNQAHQASVAGAIGGALFAHSLAELYGVSVVLHTDHATPAMLPWVDALLAAGEKYYQQNGKPLFSSHMLDLSLEPLARNLALCCTYLAKTAKLEMGLEIELGPTGGHEEGLDNSGLPPEQLYTQPEEVALAYAHLREVGDNFTIAAAFGNVHGAQMAGTVQLRPTILRDSQALVQQKWPTTPNPVHFVFHGGSGCTQAELAEAIGYGVVKVNVDTDLQWAYWQGVDQYRTANQAYLQSQIGNPEGPTRPNKAYYEPKAWLRAGELAYVDKLTDIYRQLNALNRMEG